MAAMLEKYKKQAERKMEKVREGLKKYPHAIASTLTYDENAQKYKVQIKCTKTGKTGRWVFTSDLHQVTMSEEAQAEERKVKAAAKREEEKKVREALRAKQASEKTTVKA
jgi:hypothetical protein